MNPYISRMRQILGLIAFVSGSLYAIDGLDYTQNRLKWADAQGLGSMWIKKSELTDADWFGNAELPFTMHFSSLPDPSSLGMLGYGWAIPLFESSVVEMGEDLIRWNTPGGMYDYLEKDSASAEMYSTADGEWHAKLDLPHRQFEMRHIDGREFLYKDGLIKRFAFKGSTYEWQRDPKTRWVQKVIQNGNSVIECSYVEGVLDRILFPKKGAWLKCAYSERPVFAESNGIRVITAIKPSLAKLSASNGRIWSFNITDPLAEASEGISKIELKTPQKPLQWFSWKPNGEILEDDMHHYAISMENSSNKKISTTSKANGKVESYFFNSSSMIEERILANGNIAKVWLVGTPGKSFWKIRQTQESDESGNLIYVNKFWFDLKGRLSRAVLNHKNSTGGNSGKDVSIINLEQGEREPSPAELQILLQNSWKKHQKPVLVVSQKGHVIAIKDEENSSRITEENLAGRLMTLKHAKGQDIKYIFDKAGNLVDINN